jgi:hypothetical protein
MMHPAARRPGADDRIRQLTDKKFTSSFKNLFFSFEITYFKFSPDTNGFIQKINDNFPP